MPRYEKHASILQGAGAMIFNMVCERSTPKQWAEWLRVPLEHAAGMGNADLVDKLLKAGAKSSAGWNGCHSKNLLHAAAEGGNEQVMSALMRAGAKDDMDTKAPPKGRTPLHLAVRAGKVAAAKVLMMAGADVNIPDAAGEGPLHVAIKGGHPGVAKDLLLRGADPNMQDRHGYFPIHLAARRGQDEVVRNLLHTGAQVDRLSADGSTALAVAVKENRLSAVKVLLGGGADVATQSKGHPPLHTTVYKNNTDMLAALVEAGADIEARNDRGQTPLHASAFGSTREVMLALLRRGANVHATTRSFGSTPLHIACQEGKLDEADLLLRWGADEATLNRKRRTPRAKIPKISRADEQDRPRLERLSKLLASAPQDRAWRRRGMLVLCRAHPERLRLVVEIPDTAEAIGQPQGRPSRRARRVQVKVEVAMGGARNGGEGSSARGGGGRRAAREASGGGGWGFDGVAAWLMALRDDEHDKVFRTIVGFL